MLTFARTPIVAAQSGNVVTVANNGPPCTCYGNCIIIQGDDGYTTLYAHMEDGGRPAQGSHVNARDQIGLSDTSGAATGPHLHFELGKTGGPRIDPVPCLPSCPSGLSPSPMPSGSCAYASPDQNCHQVTRMGNTIACCNDANVVDFGLPCDGDLSQPFCENPTEVAQPPYFFPGSGPTGDYGPCPAACVAQQYEYVFTCCSCPDGYVLDLPDGGPDCVPYPICQKCDQSSC